MHQAQTSDILALLDRVWPGFARVHDLAAENGLHWEACSTPFVRREGDRIVSHVGVLEVPLVVSGRAIRAAGIHAVATDPQYRGRGLMRGLMEEALRFVDQRYETAILTAGEAEIYRRFGFEAVPEHRFTGAVAPGMPDGPPARALLPGDPRDRALLHRLLRDRAPVSKILGATRELPVFLFKTAGRPLLYAADLDAILFSEVKDGALSLYDVVAMRIPSLTEIAARVPEPFDRVEVQFSPDLLEADLTAEPWVFDGDEILMARGPFLEPGSKASLPRSARC